MKCGVQLLIHSQTSKGQSLKFGNGYVISSRTLPNQLPQCNKCSSYLYLFSFFLNSSCTQFNYGIRLAGSKQVYDFAGGDVFYSVWIYLNHVVWSLCSWWRHQMETFSALLALCAGNSSVIGEFLWQRPVTRCFMFSLICDRTAVKYTVETPMIWDAIVRIMTSL